ncbi:hypothetical protein FACS1894186_8250 [Alphaproteobacteria bacterium]|nr:hypothetical protein FACS1894186_8250 [Alphaproteobacteria bacterium]
MKVGKEYFGDWLQDLPVVAWLVGWLAKGYICFLHAATRWREYGHPEELDRLLAENKPFIFVCWHGRIALLPTMRRYPKGKVKALISLHRDGRMIAEVCKRFGAEAVGGSTRKHGAKAALAILREGFADGRALGITPDGPRGPARRMSEGTVFLASRAGVPILPMSIAVKNSKFLKSWDNFMIPFPFGKGAFAVGKPIALPPDLDDTGLEKARAEVESAVNALQDNIDKELGLI